jgi:hypothetical protein
VIAALASVIAVLGGVGDRRHERLAQKKIEPSTVDTSTRR